MGDSWKPEYAEWMIEKIPTKPFDDNLFNLIIINEKLKEELQLLDNFCNKDEHIVMMSSFPLMGIGEFYDPVDNNLFNHYSNSEQIPDNIINNHIRFKTLTKNIRERRGEKVNIE